MMLAPVQPRKHNVLGAVNDHTGETVVLIKHHRGDEIEAVVRRAAGRLVLPHTTDVSWICQPIEAASKVRSMRIPRSRPR